jgi:DNA-binding beta-propeller fold protein YncE
VVFPWGNGGLVPLSQRRDSLNVIKADIVDLENKLKKIKVGDTTVVNPGTPSNMVTTDTDQDITGIKSLVADSTRHNLEFLWKLNKAAGSLPYSIAFYLGNTTTPESLLIIIAYAGLHKIEVCDRSGIVSYSIGKVGGGSGTENGQFTTPTGVAVSQINGDIFVADMGNNRVQCFSINGVWKWNHGTIAGGSGTTTLRMPYSVAVTPNGQYVYVADTGHPTLYQTSNNRIKILNAETGLYVSEFGGPGAATIQFDQPQGVAAGKSHIYVADTNNNKVKMFENVSPYNMVGWAGAPAPVGIVSDPSSEYIVYCTTTASILPGGAPDYSVRKIQLDPNGTSSFIFKHGTYGTGDGQFWGAMGICLGSGESFGGSLEHPLVDELLVADTYNNRIQSFGTGISGGRISLKGTGTGTTTLVPGLMVTAESLSSLPTINRVLESPLSTAAHKLILPDNAAEATLLTSEDSSSFAPTSHTHAPADVTGTAVTLSGDQTITGTKTFPNDSTHAPVFRGDSAGPAAALKIYDAGSAATLGVYATMSADSDAMMRTGVEVVTDDFAEAAGILKKDVSVHGDMLNNVPISIATVADFEALGIATEEYVNAAVAQVVNLATGSVITVGTESVGTYATTNVHDGSPWTIHEAGTGVGIDVQLTFSSIPSAPTALWLRAYYNGQDAHYVTAQLWNYATSAWEAYQTLPKATGYSFYSVPIPDGAEHISGGAAKVRFLHTGEGSADDHLYVDYCALVKAGLGSETIDATRTWETVQTFPVGTLVADHADIVGLGTASVENVGAFPKLVAILNLTGDNAVSAATGNVDMYADAPVGWYRMSWFWVISTRGTDGDVATFNTITHGWGGNRNIFVITPMSAAWFALSNYASPYYIQLGSDSIVVDSATVVFYNEDATHHILYAVSLPVKTGSPVIAVRARLEYLGA